MAPSVRLGFAAASRLPKQVTVINKGRGDFHRPPFEASLHSDDTREIRRVTQPLEGLQPIRASASAGFTRNVRGASRLARAARSAVFSPRREPRVVAAPAAAAAVAGFQPFRCTSPKKGGAAGGQKRKSIKKEESAVVTGESPKSVQQRQPKRKSGGMWSRGGGARVRMTKAPLTFTVGL